MQMTSLQVSWGSFFHIEVITEALTASDGGNCRLCLLLYSVMRILSPRYFLGIYHCIAFLKRCVFSKCACSFVFTYNYVWVCVYVVCFDVLCWFGISNDNAALSKKTDFQVGSWEREIRYRWHSIGITAEQAALVWACAAKRRWWLLEEMHGVWCSGSQTKRKMKEDLERGCQRGLLST